MPNKSAISNKVTDLCSEATKEVFPVFTNVSPAFMDHLCIIWGHFETELDFIGLTPIQCLEKCKIIEPIAELTEEQNIEVANKVINRYFTNELFFIPTDIKKM